MEDMRGRTQPDEEVGTFKALAAALEQYRRGKADLAHAAEEAGLDEWDLLQEAQAMPDPMAPAKGVGPDLPTFVRERR